MRKKTNSITEAEKHERSVAAILCRVNQKSLLYNNA